MPFCIHLASGLPRRCAWWNSYVLTHVHSKLGWILCVGLSRSYFWKLIDAIFSILSRNTNLDCAEGTPILFIVRKWSDLLIVILIANMELFAKDVIFNLVDSTKTYDRIEPAKSLMSCTPIRQAEAHFLKLLIPAKKFFCLGHNFMKHLQGFWFKYYWDLS